MAAEYNYQIETYVEYVGGTDEVKKKLSECPKCQEEIAYSHEADYSNMYMSEIMHCPECGYRDIKKLHQLN
jgi:C4-type Zn-finger protein